MAVNCLAPGYLRVKYTSNGHVHHMTLPVKPASVGVDFDLLQKGGGSISQNSALIGLLATIVPFYTPDDSFDSWEAFTQADCMSAPVLQNSGDLIGIVGTASSGVTVPWSQAQFTFRSTTGGRAALQIMESIILPDQKFALPAETGADATLRDYATGANTWMTARDNGFLRTGINRISKINDTLRKKYLEP